MASTTYIINFYEYINTSWKIIGLKTLSLYNHRYHPYIIISDSDNILNMRIPISIDMDYQYNNNEDSDLTFNYKNKMYGIRFDKHSKSSFNNFQKTFNTIKDKKFFTKYYDNGRIKITGEYSNDQYNGCITEYHNNNNNSIKFEGEMEDDEYVEGKFRNIDNNITLEALNITNGLINGYIKIVYKNDIDNIENDYLWQDIQGCDNINCDSSSFVDDVCSLVYGDEFIEEHKFKNFSTNNQLFRIYRYIEQINNKLEQIEQKNTGILGTVTNIYNYIFNRR